ncbi:MAG TPA: DUF427 domain-containing protein [Solirubrobacteraceae bacterium]|jgi:uncharacterized protein (DUF427 family)
MGLMTGTGPLGKAPAGEFNFEPPPPGRALYLDPSPKRIRVEVGGEVIADSRRAFLLHEGGHQPIYYFPPEDVRSEFLEASDRQTHCPKKGDASYYTIRAGGSEVEAGAWYYPEPLPDAPGQLKDLIAFYFNRMDRWLEEGEEIGVHPRDPYHRVDVVASDRQVRISLHGELLAETSRAMALFETNLPPRWYIPREDVVAELEASETVTHCPYKGAASYHSVKLAGDEPEAGKDVVWYYDDPLPESARIVGRLCFFNERVDVELDGELQERPVSPWSRPVKSEEPAQNAEPAQTRG